MSLIIIANKATNQEQFGRFIDELKSLIASNNSRAENPEEDTVATQKVDSATFIPKARELLEADNLSGLLSHALSLGTVLLGDSKSGVSSFYIFTLMVSKITDRQQQLNSVKELVNAVIKNKDISPAAQFKLLTTLFNGLGNENFLRYEVFSSILALADELNKPTILLAHLKIIDEYVSAWNLNKEQEVKLLKLAAKLITKCDNKLYREKYEFYSKFLRLLNTKYDQQVSSQVSDDVKVILRTALNYFPYEIDISTLLDLKPVQEVAKTDKDLYDLFVTAVEGNLQDFEKWKASNGSCLSNNKINEERVLDRVRLKSIFQEAQKSKSLKLKEIEKLLKFSEDETEFWIIKVHQEGYIRGKIDQLEGTLYIDGIIDDSFKNSEWKELETNLEDFRRNYENYIEKLRSERSK